MKKPPIWTITEALDVVRILEKQIAPAGFHVALGGGVLIRGSSDKDLDIMCYRHKAEEGTETGLLIALDRAGVAGLEKLTFYKDGKTVYMGFFNNKRVDLFFLL